MDQDKAVIGFIGSGGIARSHAFSLNSLKYFYDDAPGIVLEAVCSNTEASRKLFSERFGFSTQCDLKEFIANKKIDTVFILGPNKVHFEHLKSALTMTGIKRIYLEKPVCSNLEEERAIAELVQENCSVKIQVGFQFLFASAIRDMLTLWKSGKLGKPVHFDLKYYHSDYLRKEYRDRRVTRLTAAPDGGAMADLGSHSLSLLIAFLGERLRITSAIQGGHFADVREDSDLFSQISIYDDASGAVGSLSASRISSGTGDHFSIELYAQEGAVRYSSKSPDSYEFYTEESCMWNCKVMGSNYKPASSFPSAHVPSGWLRSLIHAHYVFLSGKNNNEFVPDIAHGLAVQRMVTQTAEHLDLFRKSVKNV
jgi:predicted dehydrogenase